MKTFKSISHCALATSLALGWHGMALAQPPAETGGESEIIVTGTRAVGITAAESPAPIKVFSEQALSSVGQPNLSQALNQLVPSFTAQALGGDTANLTLSAKLRGLSPNHTLVLVNGKRRHGTANLAVLSGPYQGSAAADLDLISPSSIKRIEVLEQGAAAQYGSDAIAGVINIILKDDAEGVSGYATYGQYYKTGGETAAGTIHIGQKLGDSGFVNVTAFHRFVDFTQSGGLDLRFTDPNGVPNALEGDAALLYPGAAGYPYVNRINGNPRSSLTNLQFNAGYDFGPIEWYGFGSYSKRIASAYQNVRVPTRVSFSNGEGGTTYFDPDGDNPPNGFNPREKMREDDYSLTSGLRGDISGFRYDLSVTYGQDKNEIYTIDSANASLFANEGFTPTSFYDGFFKNTEWTWNADFAKEFELGLAGPVNVAAGFEYRSNKYEIGAGDFFSTYFEGGQSYPGFRASDAGIHKRHNKSIYLDVAATPIDNLKLDAAVRYEDYSDFGDTTTYKVTSRYDFTDAIALRGTLSTGFRAPTLAESFYSATNVGPTTAFVQLPANSPAAKILGFNNLQPEKSTTYALGVVLQPVSRLTVTIDAYQVRIRNRILGTGTIFSSGGSRNFDLVQTAIEANGNQLDPAVTQTGINIFSNGADTRTRGVDFVASYLTPIGDGKATFTLAGTYNETKIIGTKAGPNLTDTDGVSGPIALFDRTTLSNLTDASPKVKIVTSAFYELGAFSGTLRGTLYGKSSQLLSPNGGDFYKQDIGTAMLFDLELGYKITSNFQLSAGANNIFDKRPPKISRISGSPDDGGLVWDAPLGFSPYGINGGYYYARINFTF